MQVSISKAHSAQFFMHPVPWQRRAAPPQEGEIVCVVDGDKLVREALSKLLASLGREVVTFRTASEYLKWNSTGSPACLILDLVLPDMSGLDLQRQLAHDDRTPIVFMSDQADIPAIVRAMKAGAIEFLTKPVCAMALEAAVNAALAQARQRRHTHSERAAMRQRFSLLTPREREVLPLVTEGLLNKQVAGALRISEVTVQVHRGQIMRKMEARSFAHLVRMADKLGIPASC
jgi:FixJ family two-component response regulator